MKRYLRSLTGLIGLLVLCSTQFGATAHAGFSVATLRVNLGVTAAPPAAPVTVNGSFTYGATCVGVVLPQLVLVFPPPAFTITTNTATPITASANLSTGAQAFASNNCTITQLTRPVAPAGFQWSGSPPDVVLTNIIAGSPPPVYAASFANVLVLPTVTAVAAPPAGGTVTCTQPTTPLATSSCNATANSGFTFNGFTTSSCGAASASNPYVTNAITSACTVTAAFSVNTLPVTTTVNIAAGGSVSCTPNPVVLGSTATCTVVTNAGYVLTSISGCGGANTNTTPSAFVTAPITTACLVSAAFAPLVVAPAAPVPTLGGGLLMLLGLLTLGIGGAFSARRPR